MLYEFICDKGHVHEVLTYDKELKEVTCPICFRPARKILSAVARTNKEWEKACH